MHLALKRNLRLLSLLAVTLTVFAAPAHSVVITLRSGNAAAGNPDPLINRLDLASSCGAGYATPFTATEFNAASTGPSAIVLSFVHPAWFKSLPCDSLARWIGTAADASPLSALFAMEFTVKSCCFTRATLDFCWGVDDALGDLVNPAGIYLNQTPIAAVSGGNFVIPSSVTGIDVTSLVNCGQNTLHIYNRDIGCAVSGVIFSATLTLTPCTVPVSPSTWGTVKALYR